MIFFLSMLHNIVNDNSDIFYSFNLHDMLSLSIKQNKYCIYLLHLLKMAISYNKLVPSFKSYYLEGYRKNIFLMFWLVIPS